MYNDEFPHDHDHAARDDVPPAAAESFETPAGEDNGASEEVVEPTTPASDYEPAQPALFAAADSSVPPADATAPPVASAPAPAPVTADATSAPSRHRVARVAAIALAVAAIGSAGFTLGRNTGGSTTIVENASSSNAVHNAADTSSSTSTEPAAAAAAKVLPAVVQIETSEGLGSGVIYDSSGHILTAAHVVTGQTTVTVRLSTGATETGQVVGANTSIDIAVVKINPPKNITPATLATGKKLQVGDLTVAIGSPFGLNQTVTAGVVSTLNRNINGQTVLQTDAAINPGNSGGPLVDIDGQVIGINTSIYSDTGDNAGIGFAIPVDVAARVASQIQSGTTPQVAHLGVGTVDSQNGQGALVQQVESGSPADKAGMQVGDVIVGVGDTTITNSSQLSSVILSHKPGDKVTLDIQRNGQNMTLTATLSGAAQ
jgi:putative serine protease PepD